MSAYRFLLGPFDFLGETIWEVQALSETGTMLSGTANDPTAALADLEAEVAQAGGAAGDWVAAPALAVAAGLPAERVGAPSAVQRRIMVQSAFLRHEAGQFWRFTDGAVLDGVLAALALLAGKATAMPPRRSWPYAASIRGDRTADFHVALSRAADSVTLAVTDSEARLRALYEAALGGRDAPETVDLAAAVVDLRPGWMADAMAVAYGVAFAPLMFQRMGGVRQPVSDLSAMLLGVMAAACPESPQAGEWSEGELEAGGLSLTCRLEPLPL
jgi:hypothetical protein